MLHEVCPWCWSKNTEFDMYDEWWQEEIWFCYDCFEDFVVF